MSTEDFLSMFALLRAHAWIPLAALAIGLTVRLLKSDTKIPLTIPPDYRRFAVLLLGIASAALERAAAGTPWKDALLGGAAAALAAVFGHFLIVDKLRDGKELPVPGLMVPGARPAPDAPVTVPPGPPKPPSLPPLAGGALLALLLSGCGLFVKSLDLAADKARCVADHQDLPNDQIWVLCAVEHPEKYLELLEAERASTRREAAKRVAEAQALTRVGACADAGAEGGK